MFLYAVGREHLYKDPCRTIMGLLAGGELSGEVSVALLQEHAHVVLRQEGDRSRALAQTRRITEICHVLDFARRDADRALQLLGRYRRLDAQDAVHAATALNRGIGSIISPDRGFDDVARLERVDPADLERVFELAGRG